MTLSPRDRVSRISAMDQRHKENIMLHVGEPAPDFELQDEQGRTVRLSDFRGKSAVVLMFYPADNTPGCTKQLCTSFFQAEDGIRDLTVTGVQTCALPI